MTTSNKLADQSHFDVIIIGAGPAGLAAADVLGSLGVQTLLVDEQGQAGGQIYRAISSPPSAHAQRLGADYLYGETLLSALRHPTVHWQGHTTVWEISEAKEVFLHSQELAWRVTAEHIIIATGALERAMPFAGWTLPGVMMAGALQVAMKSAKLIPQGNFILAGSGPLLLLLAKQIHALGGQVKALVDTTPRQNWRSAMPHAAAFLTSKALPSGIALLRELRRLDMPIYHRASKLEALGEDGIHALKFHSGGKTHTLDCDLLGIHAGVVPNTQLTRQLRLPHQWHVLGRYWHASHNDLGRTKLPWLSIAGDGAAINGAKAAQYQGEIAAWDCVVALGISPATQATEAIELVQKKLRPWLRGRSFIEARYLVAEEFRQPADATVVCRCEGVSAGAIREYVDLGCAGPNQTKAFGRCGMGLCQGRYCGLNVNEIIAAQRQQPVQEIGYYRIRSPIKPIPLGAVAKLHDAALTETAQSETTKTADIEH